MKIILAQPRHIKMAAEIFCLAFEQSITFFTPISRKVKTAIEDIFYLLHRAFGQGFLSQLKMISFAAMSSWLMVLKDCG